MIIITFILKQKLQQIKWKWQINQELIRIIQIRLYHQILQNYSVEQKYS